jgi:hypothetical protein
LTNLSAASCAALNAASSCVSRVGAAGFAALGRERVVGPVDLRQRGFLGGVIQGAEGARALERHVLEHVRQPGDAGHLLGRADVGVGEKRSHWRLMPLEHDEFPAVLKGKFSHVGLDGFEVIRRSAKSAGPGGKQERHHRRSAKKEKSGSHVGSGADAPNGNERVRAKGAHEPQNLFPGN